MFAALLPPLTYPPSLPFCGAYVCTATDAGVVFMQDESTVHKYHQNITGLIDFIAWHLLRCSITETVSARR